RSNRHRRNCRQGKCRRGGHHHDGCPRDSRRRSQAIRDREFQAGDSQTLRFEGKGVGRGRCGIDRNEVLFAGCHFGRRGRSQYDGGPRSVSRRLSAVRQRRPFDTHRIGENVCEWERGLGLGEFLQSSQTRQKITVSAVADTDSLYLGEGKRPMGLQGRYFRQRQIREAAVKAGRRILRARSDRDPKRTRDPADCGRPRGVDSSNIAGPFAALNAAFHELANYFPMPYLGFASWVASILLEHLPYAGYDIRSSCAGEVMQNYTKVRTIRARALHAGALIIGTSGLWTPSLPAAAA